MDKDRVCGIIDWAIQQGIQPYKPLPQMNPHSFHIQNLLHTTVVADMRTIAWVVVALREEEQIDQLCYSSMSIPGIGGIRLEPKKVAHWLLAQALAHNSSEIAFDLLQKFIHGEYPPTIEVFALCGFGVQEEIVLPQEVSLVPFSSLPQSEMSDFFQGRPSWYSEDWTFRNFPEPSSALIFKNHSGITVSLNTPTHTVLHDGLFQKIVLCLTLFGPSAPTPVSRWCQIENWANIPLGGTVGRGNLFLNEIIPSEKPVIIPGAGIYDVVNRYLELDQLTHQRLLLPLNRLNLAVKRQNKVDRAVELRIALESLFIDGNERDISAKIRQRGARLLGTNTVERSEIEQTLREVYRLCSRAIHTGLLDGRDDGEVLYKGIDLCAKSIREIIRRGSIPDWNSLS